MTTDPPILTYTLEEVLTRFEQKMDKQFSDVNQKMDRQFAEVNQKFVEVNQKLEKIDARFERPSRTLCIETLKYRKYALRNPIYTKKRTLSF